MSAQEPWRDWIPGVLNREQVSALHNAGRLSGHGVEKTSPDLSSFDLHLTEDAWELADGSFKPDSYYKNTYLKAPFASKITPDADGQFVLEPAQTYVFRVDERLLGFSKETPIWGQATAKSSVGRTDVLARLIVDGMEAYEAFSPDRVTIGDMFLEVTSITFRVRVKVGTALTQLRLFYGPPWRSEVRGRELLNTILPERENPESNPEECLLRVNLKPVDSGACAFRAKAGPHDLPPVDLWGKPGAPNPQLHWDLEKPREMDGHLHLKLEKGAFYILRSFERLALTKSVAAYCRAIDETIGEMRIHYAGFVHPCFGRNRADKSIGTPLIFEVRGHDLPVNLVHKEVMAKMTLYRMSEDATLDTSLDSPEKSPYSDQKLGLSKFFGVWPASSNSETPK